MKKFRGIKCATLLITISFLLHLFLAGDALGLPCRNQNVNLGETMEEVAAKCGEAALKEQRTVLVVETTTEVTGTIVTSTTTTTSTTIDEWTYLFGPEELVKSYRFEKDKLTEISINGYQAVNDFSVDLCRNGESLSIGDSTVDAYLKCGEPLAKEKLNNKVIESDYGVTKRRILIPVVEWTYRYGPDAPGYTVTFENGVAAKIRSREFGK